MGSRKFGPHQLYGVEETVNAVSDALTQTGLEVGEIADEQHYDGTPLKDMSGVLDRLLDARAELESAIGMLRAYEIYRTAQKVGA